MTSTVYKASTCDIHCCLGVCKTEHYLGHDLKKVGHDIKMVYFRILVICMTVQSICM